MNVQVNKVQTLPDGLGFSRDLKTENAQQKATQIQFGQNGDAEIILTSGIKIITPNTLSLAPHI